MTAIIDTSELSDSDNGYVKTDMSAWLEKAKA